MSLILALMSHPGLDPGFANTEFSTTVSMDDSPKAAT
jgi:hypothetical protein